MRLSCFGPLALAALAWSAAACAAPSVSGGVVASPQKATLQGEVTLHFQGRDLYLHVPASLPPEGERALVVVLHGGMGNAERLVAGGAEKGLNLDAAADAHGFLAAYLNGSPVTRRLGDSFRGWNAGECCGYSAEANADDAGYIAGAVRLLQEKYGAAPAKTFAVGHSNGAMMILRLLCESDVFAAAVPVSGALELEASACPRAAGKAILALHGEEDENVPYAGGRGKGLSRTDFRSQEYTKGVFLRSGARYTLQRLPKAGHRFEEIDAAIRAGEGVSFAEKAARFFGL
jgi:poly(3-hydroxybutyrate) depolymerase